MTLNSAWAAGFFDGEGCITITKQPTIGRNPTYHPVANLVNSHKQSLMLFKQKYGGNIYTHQKKAKHHLGRYWACKVDVWLWCCPVKALPRLLRDMLPYLTVKAQYARVLLRFLEERQSQYYYKGGKISSEELLKRENFFKEIHAC